MNRADQGKPTRDLDKGRGWLERAERGFEREFGALKRDRVVELAAAIGTGFALLGVAALVDELLQRDLSLQEQDQLRRRRAAQEARPHDKPAPKGGLADQLIAIANAVYGNDTGNVLDAPTGHGLAAVVRTLADGPLIQTEWAAAQFRKLAVELETAGEADRG